MLPEELELCAQQLRNRVPLLGTRLRRKASAKLAADASAEAVPLLLEALVDSDEMVRGTAEAALLGLSGRDAIDALCGIALDNMDGAAAKLCLETGKRPSDHEQACLFLFVTRQLDEYFQEDYEFQTLRSAYERASDPVKARVMEVVRSGDRRCLGFFGRRKPLVECSEGEIRLAIESALRHRDWPRLFRAFQELPMRYGYPLLEHFRQSGWEPEQPDLVNLYRAVLEQGDAILPSSPPKFQHASPVFERWLNEGRSGPLAALPEAELLQKLAQAPPPEGCAIVAALATKTVPGGEASRTVQSSRHWLIRLAGYATGLCSADITQDSLPDDNYWVRELVPATSVLDFWPVKATPADLEKINSAPQEAFTGTFGAVRRVLRLLLAHRETTPEITEVVLDAGEFAGEFVEVN